MSFPVPGPSSAGPSYLSPRERMMLAKAAMMEEEEMHAAHKRERRKSRRASSIAFESSGAGSRRSSFASIAENTSPMGSTRGKPAPPSILRRPQPLSSFPSSSAPFSPSSSASSIDSYTALPAPISRFSSLNSLRDFAPDAGSCGKTPRIIRRRSSRVRFTDDPLPPASVVVQAPSPPNSAGLEDSSFDQSLVQLSPPAASSSLRRMSSLDGLRQDIARSSRVLSLSLDTRASIASYMSDPFGLSNSPMARVSESDFCPQPLPVPKLSRRMSQISIASTSGTSCSERGSTSSPSSTPLRDVVNRSSLNITTKVRYSSTPSYTSSVRHSFGSVASTMLSASSDSGSGLPRGAAYSSLLPQADNELDPQRIPTMNRDLWQDADLGLSPRSGPSPVVKQEPAMPDQMQVPNGAPMFISPFAEARGLSDGLITPLDMSNPFEKMVLATPIVPSPSRVHHLDSIDLLPPARESIEKSALRKESRHIRSDSSLSAVMSFPIPPMRDLAMLDVAITPTREFDSFNRGPISPLPVMDEVCLDTPRPDDSSASTFSSPPSLTSPPTSPDIAKIAEIEQEVVAMPVDAIETKATCSPLLDVALRSGILSPNSKLVNRLPSSLRPSPRRSWSDSYRRVDHVEGWSGSESEEEEFTQTIRAITLRKLSEPKARPKMTRAATASADGLRHKALAALKAPSTGPLPSRPTLDRLSGLSQASSSSVISSDSSAGPVTPCTTDSGPSRPTHIRTSSNSSSGSTIPGDFPWGGSAPASPTGSIRSGKSGSLGKGIYEGLDEVNKSLKRSSKSKTRRLPLPTRRVEGWGEPEVLIDEDWPPSPSYAKNRTSLGSGGRASPASSNGPSLSGEATPRVGETTGFSRSSTPDSFMAGQYGLGLNTVDSMWSSLLDEDLSGMPEIGDEDVGMAM